MRCWGCGQEVAPGAERCPACGWRPTFVPGAEAEGGGDGGAHLPVPADLPEPPAGTPGLDRPPPPQAPPPGWQQQQPPPQAPPPGWGPGGPGAPPPGWAAEPPPASPVSGGPGGEGARPWALLAGIALVVVLFLGGVIWRLSASSGDDETAADTTTTEAPGDATTTTVPRELPPPPAVDVPEGGFDAAGVAAAFGDAILRIDVEDCGVEGGGSGFAIGPHHVVTNQHVAVVDTTPVVVSRDGTEREGVVIGMVAEPDVALIEVREPLPLWVAWADPTELTEGQPLVALGYPLPAQDFTVTSLAIASFEQEGEQRTGIRADGRIDRGNSGGPSLTLDGTVAGINTAVNINPGGQSAGIFGGGVQIVPLIQTHAAVATSLDGFLASGAPLPADCSKATYEEALAYGDSPELDALWDECAAGDPFACDILYRESKVGSEYEQFGASCGGRVFDGRGYCVQRSGGQQMPPP